VHVKDNPALGEACQVGETVWYDAAWDDRKRKMKGINLSLTGAGSVGCYGGGGGQSGRKIGKGQGGNDRSAASSSTSLTLKIAHLMGYESIEAAETSLASIPESELPPMSSMQVQSPWVVNRPGVGSAYWQRVQHAPQFDTYHIPEFSSEVGETSASWKKRARALLKEWRETFQRQTEGADKSGRASPLYEIHCEKAV